MSSLIPTDLNRYCPDQGQPYNISPGLFNRATSAPFSACGQYRIADITSSDPEWAFILKYFEHSKPPGYGIRRAVVIHNPTFTDSFIAGIPYADSEAQNPTFKPRWNEMSESTQRSRTIERWKAQSNQFTPVKTKRGIYQHVRILPLWHGTNSGKYKSIASSGFAFFGKHEVDGTSTDPGYFGSGMYFTGSAKYAAMYASGYLVMAWVQMREPFPVVSDESHPGTGSDMRMLMGKEKFKNFNAHYIPVVSKNKNNSSCMVYIPCHRDETPAWDEFVVFEKSQTLPRFCIELASDGLYHPQINPVPQQVYTFSQADAAAPVSFYQGSSSSSSSSQNPVKSTPTSVKFPTHFTLPPPSSSATSHEAAKSTPTSIKLNPLTLSPSSSSSSSSQNPVKSTIPTFKLSSPSSSSQSSHSLSINGNPGDPAAKKQLAIGNACHRDGENDLAVQAYKSAASLKNAQAMYMLACYYKTGWSAEPKVDVFALLGGSKSYTTDTKPLGSKPDLAESRYWLKQAADNGHQEAKQKLSSW
ncbi:MAG: hypothetical protein KDK65_03295 [Chlamydiia bacterium]|nr:hypothetical protein [Chlamydiia bacterium]